jgi:hypothetical protein
MAGTLLVYPRDFNGKPTKFEAATIEQRPSKDNSETMVATFVEENPETKMKTKKKVTHNLAYMFVEDVK